MGSNSSPELRGRSISYVRYQGRDDGLSVVLLINKYNDYNYTRASKFNGEMIL